MLDDSFEFKSENGFSIAAMFTAYDNDPEPVLTPDYGELVFRYGKWGQYANGTFYDIEEVLETHYCTPEELGLNKDSSDHSARSSRFLPIRPLMHPWLDFYQKKMLCTDQSEMMIRGDYNS